MKIKKITAEEMEAVKKELRAFMPKGSTVFTIVRHVSRSGMQRVISPVVFRTSGKKGEVFPIFPDYQIAQVCGWTLADSPEGIKLGGCGMDMGFHLVYTLSQVLYGDGYALNQRWL